MIKSIVKFILFINLVVIVSSCGDSPLFSTLQDSTPAIDIKTISDGQVLSPDKNLSLQIINSSSDEKDISLEITLKDVNANIISTSTIDSPGLNEDITLELPRLSDGEYTIIFKVIKNGETVSEKTRTFFYITGIYQILGIQSDPPVISPNTEVKLKADLNIPDNSNPFLRWSQNGKVIASGTVSEGRDSIEWETPKKEGVYSIKVELFPAAPPAADNDYTFASSIYLSSEMYVTAPLNKSSYYSAMYFNNTPEELGMVKTALGTFSGSGNAQDFTITPIGSPNPDRHLFTAGYSLSSGEGFFADYSIIPAENGRIEPFTLSLDFALSALPEHGVKGSILSVNDGQGSPFFQLQVNDSSELEASFRTADSTLITLNSGFKIEPSGEITKVSLSVFPSDNSTEIIWFKNGFQKKSETTDINYTGLNANAVTIVGGQDSFTGSIYKLTVFYRDEGGNSTIDPDILNDELTNTYKENLIFADGFDGRYLNSDITVNGEWQINSGFLILKQSAQIETEPIKLDTGSYRFTIALSPESKSMNNGDEESLKKRKISIIDTSTGNEIFAILTSGAVVFPEQDSPVTLNETDSTNLSFTLQYSKKNGSISLLNKDLNKDNSGKESNLLLENSGEASISLKIVNPEKDDLSIDYITVIKTDENQE